MKLTANVKLLPSSEQSFKIAATLHVCNIACNWLSRLAWKTGTFRQFDLHNLAYTDLRQRFGLSAQVSVRCIAKVADAYKKDKKTPRKFRANAAQPYDSRILTFKKNDTVSIWVLGGRINVSFTCGQHQRNPLQFRKGEADLMLVRGEWCLACCCDVPDVEAVVSNDVIGVDLGVVNLAVDSNGTVYDGDGVEKKRHIYAHRRRNLQRNGSRSSKRKLKKISGRQARFQKDTNHRISKAIVLTAERTQSGIALEDLSGIRDGVRVRRRQRARIGNWGFYQLRSFIEYKAKRLGIPVTLVDPRNTSRECPVCGHIAKANRLTRDQFCCVCCGLAGPADHIAARNIRSRARAAVNQPMVAGIEQCDDPPSYKPPTLVGGS